MSAFGDQLELRRIEEGQPGVAAGWSRLGEVLGGNGAVQQNAYQRGMQQGVQAADVMEQARRRRDANVGFSSITPDLVRRANAGDVNAQAALAASELHAGGGNAAEMATAGLTNARSSALWDALNRARGGGGIGDINTDLAITQGKPLETTKIEGNTVLNPYGPTNQPMSPTAVGQSDISKALAEASQANAGAYRNTQEGNRAKAGIGADKAGNYEIVTDGQGHAIRVNKLTGEELPVTDASGTPLTMATKGGGTGPMSDPKPSAIDQAFGKASQFSMKANPEYTSFKVYQQMRAQNDPKFNNGDYALAQYLADKANNPGGGSSVPQQMSRSAIGAAMDGTNQGAQPNGGTGQPVNATAQPATSGGSPYQVGQTATNPKTGEKLMWNGTAWVTPNG